MFHLAKLMRAEKVSGRTESDVVASCELFAETAELATSLTFIAAERRTVVYRAYAQ